MGNNGEFRVIKNAPRVEITPEIKTVIRHLLEIHRQFSGAMDKPEEEAIMNAIDILKGARNG